MTQDNREVFIDADEGFSSEKNSYEQLILKQINECMKVLSKEMTGGQVVHKASLTGVEKYIEDVRELVINHVDTLRMLLCTYIKDDNQNQINIILKEIKDHENKIKERKMILPGKGQIALKDIKGISPDNVIWKEYIHYKALRYREIFEILIMSYNQQKAYIRSLEEE